MSTKSNTTVSIKRLVVTAMLIALGTALSLIRWQMPLGGEITLLSMLPVALISIEYGIAWGVLGAFVFSLVQLGIQFGMVAGWGLSAAAFIGCIAFDYILAYASIGLSGIFRKKGVLGICLGIFVAMLVRFAFHLLSGTIIFAEWMPEGWSNPLLYSVCYNGVYMLPEFVLTTIGAVILFKTPSFNKLVSGNLK